MVNQSLINETMRISGVSPFKQTVKDSESSTQREGGGKFGKKKASQ